MFGSLHKGCSLARVVQKRPPGLAPRERPNRVYSRGQAMSSARALPVFTTLAPRGPHIKRCAIR